MDVPAPDPRAQAKAERAAGLYDVMEAAAAWFVEQLDGVEGGAARAYLKERGDRRGHAARLRLRLRPRFARQAQGRAQAVRQREAGRGRAADRARGRAKEPYDRFRGRLMFPIRDPRGRCIAFGGPHPRRRRAQISEFARHAAVRQGPQPVQPREGRAGEPRGEAGDRRRRPDGRDRARPGRDRRGGRAARHGAHRSAARPALAAVARADPLLRRRRGRAERGDARRACAPCRGRAGALARLRHPARRARIPTTCSAPAAASRSTPCSSGPSRWSSGLWRHEVEAEPLRHARAARRPQAAAARPCRGDRRSRRARAISPRPARPVQRADPARAAPLDRATAGRMRGRFTPPPPPRLGRRPRRRPRRAQPPARPRRARRAAPLSRSDRPIMARRSRRCRSPSRASPRMRDAAARSGDDQRRA